MIVQYVMCSAHSTKEAQITMHCSATRKSVPERIVIDSIIAKGKGQRARHSAQQRTAHSQQMTRQR